MKYKQVKIDMVYILKPSKKTFFEKLKQPFKNYKRKKQIKKAFDKYCD